MRAAANSVVFIWTDNEVIVENSTTDPPMPFTKPTLFVLRTSSGIIRYLLHTATLSTALPFHGTSTESNVRLQRQTSFVLTMRRVLTLLIFIRSWNFCTATLRYGADVGRTCCYHLQVGVRSETNISSKRQHTSQKPRNRIDFNSEQA